MAGYSRAASLAGLTVSLAVHAGIFAGALWIYRQDPPPAVTVNHILDWEWAEYAPEPAPAAPPSPPLPPPEPESEPEPEIQPEAKPEPVIEEKTAPVEIKKIEKKPPPKKEPPKEKPKPKKEKPKDKPKEKTQPKREREPVPEERGRAAFTPPPARVITPPVPSATYGQGQTPNAPLRTDTSRSGLPDGKPGGKAGGGITTKNYNTGLQQRIASAVAKRKGRIRDRGTAIVAFDIQASGAFSNIRIEQSSGVRQIDDLILDAVRSVGRYAAPPEGQTVSRRIPLNVK